MHFLNLTLTIKLPTNYYDPRTTKPCHAVRYTHKDHTDIQIT